MVRADFLEYVRSYYYDGVSGLREPRDRRSTLSCSGYNKTTQSCQQLRRAEDCSANHKPWVVSALADAVHLADPTLLPHANEQASTVEV